MYIALQLCENKSLRGMVETHGCFTEPEVRQHIIQITGAIKYMHRKKVVHRDLKLENIFLDSNMNIKIGDFGLTTSNRRSTVVSGSLQYMAPEMLESQSRGYDERIELWSLGLIMQVFPSPSYAPC